MSMTSKERVYKWRRLNPEKFRAYDRAYKKQRRSRGVRFPSDSPDRKKARVYRSRAKRKFMKLFFRDYPPIGDEKP
jgi:hypothetical protein